VAVNFGDRDPSRSWLQPESLRRLDEVLYSRVQVRLATNEIPHESQVTLQTVVAEWDYAQQVPLLQSKAVRLLEMRPHLTPEVAALADGYRTVLEEYLRGRLRASSQTAARPGSSSSSAATAVGSALRQLQALDNRRQRLWNPGPVAARAGAARPSPAAKLK